MLAKLGKQPDQVFPLTYNTNIDLLLLGSVSGRVDGFGYFDWTNGPSYVPKFLTCC